MALYEGSSLSGNLQYAESPQRDKTPQNAFDCNGDKLEAER